MRRLTWTVVSNKMMNTAVILVERSVMNKIYKKRYTVSKKYKVHTDVILEVGQKVVITETKPRSKTKSWEVLEVVS